MGVTDLWSILQPVKQHKPLSELVGEVIAVDLSVWVCETQQLQKVFTKPYLRNLFFRVLHLVQLGVHLVFVVDGNPPEVKWGTIQKRLQASGRGGRAPGQPRTGDSGARMTRSHFKRLSKECCDMLDYLGVPHVQSVGEAEAMCALLNRCGLVDACLTNDGDAFLYGARKVYKNFTIDKKDPHVESYSMDDIERDLALDQERLVALALLLGCDYLPKGVPGVGKETAIKFFNAVPQGSLLARFRIWVSIDSRMSPSIGGDCAASEVAVRKKALLVDGFPNHKVIDEFLITKDKPPRSKFVWKRPKVFHFQTFSRTKMEWEQDYALDKVLPLLTLYDMRSLRDPATAVPADSLVPRRIVKARVRHRIPCFEVEWNKLVRDDVTSQPYYTTIESRALFSAAFSEMAARFDEDVASRQRKKPSKGKTTSTKEEEKAESETASVFDHVADQLQNLRISRDPGRGDCEPNSRAADGNPRFGIGQRPDVIYDKNAKPQISAFHLKDLEDALPRARTIPTSDLVTTASSFASPSDQASDDCLGIGVSKDVVTADLIDPQSLVDIVQCDDDDDVYVPLSQRLALKASRNVMATKSKPQASHVMPSLIGDGQRSELPRAPPGRYLVKPVVRKHNPDRKETAVHQLRHETERIEGAGSPRSVVSAMVGNQKQNTGSLMDSGILGRNHALGQNQDYQVTEGNPCTGFGSSARRLAKDLLHAAVSQSEVRSLSVHRGNREPAYSKSKADERPKSNATTYSTHVIDQSRESVNCSNNGRSREKRSTMDVRSRESTSVMSGRSRSHESTSSNGGRSRENTSSKDSRSHESTSYNAGISRESTSSNAGRSRESTSSHDGRSRHSTSSNTERCSERTSSKDGRSFESTSSNADRSRESTSSYAGISRDRASSNTERYSESTSSKDSRSRESTCSAAGRSRETTSSTTGRSLESTSSNAGRSRESTSSNADRSREGTSSDADKSRDSTSSNTERYREGTSSTAGRSRETTSSTTVRSRESTSSNAGRSREGTSSNACRSRESTSSTAGRTHASTSSNTGQSRDSARSSHDVDHVTYKRQAAGRSASASLETLVSGVAKKKRSGKSQRARRMMEAMERILAETSLTSEDLPIQASNGPEPDIEPSAVSKRCESSDPGAAKRKAVGESSTGACETLAWVASCGSSCPEQTRLGNFVLETSMSFLSMTDCSGMLALPNDAESVTRKSEAVIRETSVTKERTTVARDKAARTQDTLATAETATVTIDRTTVTTDRATVTTDRATVTTDRATVTTDRATVTTDSATVTKDLAVATKVTKTVACYAETTMEDTTVAPKPETVPRDTTAVPGWLPCDKGPIAGSQRVTGTQNAPVEVLIGQSGYFHLEASVLSDWGGLSVLLGEPCRDGLCPVPSPGTLGSVCLSPRSELLEGSDDVFVSGDWCVARSVETMADRPMTRSAEAMADRPMTHSAAAMADRPMTHSAEAMADRPMTRSAEAMADRPMTHSAEAMADRPMTRSAEAMADRPMTCSAEAMAERPMTRSAEAMADRPMTHSTEIMADRPMTRSAEAMADRAMTHSAEAMADRPMTRSAEAMADRPVTHSAETMADRPMTHSAEAMADRPMTHSAEAMADRPMTRSAEAMADRPMTRSAEAMADRPMTHSAEPMADRPMTRSAEAMADRPMTHSTEIMADRPMTRSAEAMADRPMTHSVEAMADRPMTHSAETMADRPMIPSAEAMADRPMTHSAVAMADRPMTQSVEAMADRLMTHGAEAMADRHMTHSVEAMTDQPMTHSAEAMTDRPMTHSVEAMADRPMTHSVEAMAGRTMTCSAEAMADRPMTNSVEAMADRPMTCSAEAMADRPMTNSVEAMADRPMNHFAETKADRPMTHSVEAMADRPMTHSVEAMAGRTMTCSAEAMADRPMTNSVEAMADRPMNHFAETMADRPMTHSVEAMADRPMPQSVEAMAGRPMTRGAEAMADRTMTQSVEAMAGRPMTHNVDAMADRPMTQSVEAMAGQPMTHSADVMADRPQIFCSTSMAERTINLSPVPLSLAERLSQKLGRKSALSLLSKPR